MSDGWIVIPNWDRFQHYRDRNPAWIKLYTELQYDEEWLRLSLRLRGILVGLWIEYALSRRVLGASPARLGRKLGDSTVRHRDLERLRDAGFIELSASKPLAQRERQREKRSSELSKPRRRSSAKRAAPELLNFPEYLETLH